MNTLAALSSGEWLMKPSSLERETLQSKALCKYTIENLYLLCCHYNQSYYCTMCGGAGPGGQSSGHICETKTGKP